MECFSLLFDHLAWIKHQFLSGWHKRFKEGRESVRDDERCGRSKEVKIPELIGQRVRVRVTMLRFLDSSARDSVGRGQHSSNRVSGISRTMHQSTTPSLSLTICTRWSSRQFLSPPYSSELAPCDFWLFPKLRGCHYETSEKTKEAVRKVIDTLTQEDFHGAFQKLLERNNKCIAAGGLRRGLEFHECTINKSARTKKVWKLI